MKIEVFSSRNCPACELLKQHLKKLKIKYKEIDVEKSDDPRVEKIRSVPVLFKNGKLVMIGCPVDIDEVKKVLQIERVIR